MLKLFIKHLISKIRFHGKVKVCSMAVASRYSKFEGMDQLYPHSTFHGTMGIGCYIGSHSKLSARIGRFTSISNNVCCNPGIHAYQYP